jgi:hypothetical protein
MALTKFHENLLSGSKFISRGLTERETDSHFGMIGVTFNVITTTQNFIHIHQSVQTLYHLRALTVHILE